jgi:hypothetical protein
MHEDGGQNVIRFFTIKLDRDGKWVSVEAIAEKAGKVFYLDSDGKPVWLTSLGIEIGMQRKVVETLDGGYAMAGPLPQDSSGSNIHIVKTDANGAFVWEKNLCRDKNIQQTWEKEIVCSYNYVNGVIQSQDGGYVMTGGLGMETWLIKMDTNGNLEWIQSFLEESPNTGNALMQLPDGGYLIAGSQLIDEQRDGMLIKTDSAGNLQWSRTFGGDQEDWFRMMKQSPNSEIIIMGWTESFGEGSHNTWLLGIDPITFE